MINVLQVLAAVLPEASDALSKVPPEAYEGLGKTIVAIAKGQPESAEREARLTAETVAAKLVIGASYEAGVRARGQ